MFDLVTFVKGAGYAGVGAMVFAESGLFVGFFLPGDSLLFTAGFLASQGFLEIAALVTVSFFAAVLGDSVGYSFGRRVGPKIFTRENSLFFDREHVARAHAFYERHGGKAITLARFMPVVRTFAPIVAGVGNMGYATFLLFNICGALVWACGVPLIGFYLGRTVPHVDAYLLPIVLGIIVLSVSPSIVHLMRNRPDRVKFFSTMKKVFFKSHI